MRSHLLHHGDEVSAPMMNGQLDLAIVVARIRCAVDEQEAELTGIRGERQVSHCHCMRMIPACSRRVRCQLIAQRLARSNERRTFFRCAVILRIGRQPMPMDKISIFRCIGHIDGDCLILLQTKSGTRDLPVVCDRRNVNSLADLQSAWLYAQSKIRLPALCKCHQRLTLYRG